MLNFLADKKYFFKIFFTQDEKNSFLFFIYHIICEHLKTRYILPSVTERIRTQ